MKNKYSATFIGLIFSISSMLATATFIIPFITVLPLSLTLENVFKNNNENASYSEIGPFILNTMWLVLIITSLLFYVFVIVKLRQGNAATKKLFILFLIVQLFIVHPLFFYIDTSKDWERASDGQFILGITDTFPVSSFCFVVFGILLDVIRLIVKSKQKENGLVVETNLNNKITDS